MATTEELDQRLLPDFGAVPGAVVSFAESAFGLRSISSATHYRMNEFFDLAHSHFEELNEMMTPTGRKKFRTLWNTWSKARYEHRNSLTPVYATEGAIEALVSLLRRYCGNPGDSARAGVIVSRLKSQRQPAEQANRAVIVASVSAFEVLLGNLVHALLLKAPGKISEGPQFSVGELLKYASIDDVIESAIRRKVETLVARGGIDDWASWFQKKSPLKIDLASLALDWGSTREVFKRRNAIVHTNSKVNSDYRSAVTNAPVEGVELNTSAEYVETALENVLISRCPDRPENMVVGGAAKRGLVVCAYREHSG
jgi:hypothetical protein